MHYLHTEIAQYVKKEINAKNQRPQKEYYTLAKSFRYAIRCNEFKQIIYLCEGAYLWMVFSFNTMIFIQLKAG